MTADLHRQKERHLKDYIEVLKRRRDIAVTFFVSTVLIVTISSFIMKPVYRATVTILIDPESPNVLTATGMVALKSDDYLSYKDYFQSQLMIIDSYSLAKKVFGDFKLGETREYRGLKEPVKNFLSTIRVDPVPDTRLVKLSVDNGKPQLAADMANRIAELYIMQNLYHTSKGEILNLLKNEYLKLETKSAEYAKVYKEGHPEMIKLRTEMADMVKRMDNQKGLINDYDTIEDSLKNDSGRTLASFKANNVRIQEPAEKPIKPVKPKKRLNFLLSVVIGFLGGVGLVFFLEYLDDTVKTSDDIERVADWPMLGSIAEIADAGVSELDKDIFVSVHPKDPVAEMYKSIRTRILFASTEERPLNSVIITSPGPQEGKTTTLCNLGLAISQNKKRVLLVDADMRRPRIHNIFKKENAVGLSNYLSGQCPFDEVVQKTGIENVSIVSGGVLPPNPSELLSSHKLKEFVEKATESFDVVLLDTPPIGVVTDAAIASRAVAGTIMVVQSGKTSKRALAHIYQLLVDARARVVGVVLNRISVTGRDRYYYAYYQSAGKSVRPK